MTKILQFTAFFNVWFIVREVEEEVDQLTLSIPNTKYLVQKLYSHLRFLCYLIASVKLNRFCHVCKLEIEEPAAFMYRVEEGWGKQIMVRP